MFIFKKKVQIYLKKLSNLHKNYKEYPPNSNKLTKQIKKTC